MLEKNKKALDDNLTKINAYSFVVLYVIAHNEDKKLSSYDFIGMTGLSRARIEKSLKELRDKKIIKRVLIKKKVGNPFSYKILEK